VQCVRGMKLSVRLKTNGLCHTSLYAWIRIFGFGHYYPRYLPPNQWLGLRSVVQGYVFGMTGRRLSGDPERSFVHFKPRDNAVNRSTAINCTTETDELGQYTVDSGLKEGLRTGRFSPGTLSAHRIHRHSRAATYDENISTRFDSISIKLT